MIQTFENKSYIPIKDNLGKIKLDVKGENELFKLDKDITLNIVHVQGGTGVPPLTPLLVNFVLLII